MARKQTISELLAELDADPDRRHEVEELVTTQQFKAELEQLQELIAQEKLTQDLLRKRALEELADERLNGRSASTGAEDIRQQGEQNASGKVRRRFTISEADCIAEREFKRLRTIDNQSEWARVIGCNRKLIKKLSTWQKAEKYRREYQAGIRKKLRRSASQELLAALSGDSSIIANLSDEDRELWNNMTDQQRAELYKLVNEDES